MGFAVGQATLLEMTRAIEWHLAFSANEMLRETEKNYYLKMNGMKRERRASSFFFSSLLRRAKACQEHKRSSPRRWPRDTRHTRASRAYRDT